MEMGQKVLSITRLKSFEIPLPTRNQQQVFDKLSVYMDSNDYECRSFFCYVADSLVEELCFHDNFCSQNISLFDCLKEIPWIEDSDDEKEIKIKDAYKVLSAGGSELSSILKVASGIIYSYYNWDEENK